MNRWADRNDDDSLALGMFHRIKRAKQWKKNQLLIAFVTWLMA